MVDFFDKIYNSINNKNNFFERIKLYSLLRFSVRVISNVTLPFYFLITQNNGKFKLSPPVKKNERVIVSLTSFPARINNLWIVIESILRQTHKPDKLILWLSKEQFSSLDFLPKKLLNMRKRGLEIEIRENDLRSHKKYFYTIKEYPDDTCITIDDDVIYESHLIETLIKCSNSFPNMICCTHTSSISYEEKKLKSYNDWIKTDVCFSPSLVQIPIGVGGVLYPAGILHESVLDKDAFLKHCPNADDIWLKAMSLLNNVKVVKAKFNSSYLPVLNFYNKTLSSSNLKGGNDIQLKALRLYCLEKFTIDPFSYSYIYEITNVR